MKKLILLIFIFLQSINAFTQNIQFNATELYPEGIAYNQKENIFYVSSLHYGKIGKVNSKGEYSEFINDKELVSTIGIHLNKAQNLLYVCVSDPGVAVNTSAATQMKLAKIIAFDTKTGKKKFVSDLGALNKDGNNFANDLDFDSQGNAYVTNSASPVIYKINKKGTASVFATSYNWKKEGFNLNGIVFHPNGYLIAVQSNTGELFKIELKNPKNITKITTDLFLGGDGLILNGKNELVVISNLKKEAYIINTTDNFATAKVSKTTATEMDFPTTGVFVNNKYFVLNAKLNEIFTPNSVKTSNFLIQEMKF